MKSELYKTKTINQTIEYLDEKIKYMECIKNHLTTCKLIEQEKNMALQKIVQKKYYLMYLSFFFL